MIGIAAYSVYTPRYRVRRELISAAWGKPAVAGARVAGHFDEDSLTMGYAAAYPLARTGAEPDRLLFASTSAPYWQRSSASQIAAACDLAGSTATADFGSSLRCGSSALIAAVDAIRAGSANQVLVAASERRDGVPESPEEMSFGDAAAALTVSREGVVAEFIAAVSRSDDFLDEWRRDCDTQVLGYSSKYTVSRGYEANIVACGKELFAKAGITAAEVGIAAIPSPDGRAHLACAKALGIAAKCLVDPGVGDAGITGSAMPLIALARALEAAKKGDLIFCAGYGEGADALLFRAVASGSKLRRDPRTIEYATYPLFRKSRDFMSEGSGSAEISNILWKREERQNIRLHGTKCPQCGTVGFPVTRICAGCRNGEGLLEIPLGRTGRVFTFTKDFLYDAPVQPTVMTVVDLDGGGRFMCQMTDVEEREVRIGIPVELVLRRMREGATNHHYYWKCRPV